MKTVEDLLALVEETDPGDVVTLTVHRGADAGKVETLSVKTVERGALRG